MRRERVYLVLVLPNQSNDVPIVRSECNEQKKNDKSL